MSLLQDISAHLKTNGVSVPINFNFSKEKNENCIVLWQYDGTPNALARNSKVQITVKNTNMQLAEKMADSIYSILYPMEQFQKAIEINGKLMHIYPIQEPFYNEQDQNNRHCYVFNINIDYDRKI